MVRYCVYTMSHEESLNHNRSRWHLTLFLVVRSCLILINRYFANKFIRICVESRDKIMSDSTINKTTQ